MGLPARTRSGRYSIRILVNPTPSINLIGRLFPDLYKHSTPTDEWDLCVTVSKPTHVSSSTFAKTVCPISDSLKLAEKRLAPTNAAPKRFERKRFARDKLAFEKSTFSSFAPRKFAPERSASAKLAPVKSQPTKATFRKLALL